MNIDPIWGKLIAGAIGGVATAVIILQYAKIRILKRELRRRDVNRTVDFLWE